LNAPGSKCGWTVPLSTRLARPQGEMRPAPPITQPPPGVAVPSESPKPPFSPEPVARPAFRHRNVPGIGSRNCPRKGPCTAWHSTWAQPRGAPRRATVLGVLSPRHQGLRIEGHSFRSACSRFPFACAWGPGLRPFVEERLTLSQGPAADPGDDWRHEPPVITSETRSSILRRRTCLGTLVTVAMIKLGSIYGNI
jgi:hypothetical protein